MTHGVNETSIFTLSSITDTNEHDLPDVDGGEAPYDVRSEDRASVYIQNHADQPLTARLERSHGLEGDFAGEEVTDTGGVTVAAGDTQAIAADPDFPLDFLRVVISFDTAPTSTDPSVTARYQADKRGV